MTSKQLERKVNQLYSRKRLIDTVESLEEAIMTFMVAHGKTEIHTEKFTISLVDGRLDISMRVCADANQLILNFTNPKEKEEGSNESIDP